MNSRPNPVGRNLLDNKHFPRIIHPQFEKNCFGLLIKKKNHVVWLKAARSATLVSHRQCNSRQNSTCWFPWFVNQCKWIRAKIQRVDFFHNAGRIASVPLMARQKQRGLIENRPLGRCLWVIFSATRAKTQLVEKTKLFYGYHCLWNEAKYFLV